MDQLSIRFAKKQDTALILTFIKKLAQYEQLESAAIANEALLKKNLFGEHAYAEVIIAEYQSVPVGFALFFHNFSTFLGKPGLYLEDLFVKQDYRGKGIGKALLQHLAQIAEARDCGRMEWWVLNWNTPSIAFYKSIAAVPMDEWTVFRLTKEKLQALAHADISVL